MAHEKIGSSAKDRFWGVTGGLAILKRRSCFTVLREYFIFPFIGGERIRLGPGSLRNETLTGSKSTCISSTTVEIRTPYCDVDSLEDGFIPPRANHWSVASFTIQRRSSAFPRRIRKSVRHWADNWFSTWEQGSINVLLVILSQMAAAPDKIAIPDSGMKLRWVNCELRTKFCKWSKTSSTSSASIANPA